MAMSLRKARYMISDVIAGAQIMGDMVVEELTKDDGSLNTMEYLAATTLVRRIVTANSLSILLRYEYRKENPRPVIVGYLMAYLHDEVKEYYGENSEFEYMTAEGIPSEGMFDFIKRVVESLSFISPSSQVEVANKVADTMKKVVTGEVINKSTMEMVRRYRKFG